KETVLLTKRGRGLKIVDHSVRQVIFATLGQLHSEKPQQVHEGLERLYGNVRRLELFARRERAGWTTWGTTSRPRSQRIYNANQFSNRCGAPTAGAQGQSPASIKLEGRCRDSKSPRSRRTGCVGEGSEVGHSGRIGTLADKRTSPR